MVLKSLKNRPPWYILLDYCKTIKQNIPGGMVLAPCIASILKYKNALFKIHNTSQSIHGQTDVLKKI